MVTGKVAELEAVPKAVKSALLQNQKFLPIIPLKIITYTKSVGQPIFDDPAQS